MTAVPAAKTAELRRLADTTDEALGAQFLQNVPTNELRPAEDLLQFSSRAGAFGRDLAAVPQPSIAPVQIVERTGGLAERAIARYSSRSHRIELFTDTVAYCEELIDGLGWRGLFPAGIVRSCAIEHERAHHLITADRSRALRAALGREVFRFGRHRRMGYIAGSDELAAHAFAGRVLGLERSPLLISAAAAAALGTRTVAGAAGSPKED